MKKALVLAFVLLVAVAPLRADVISIGLNRALANSLYCQLAGCTMTGAVLLSDGTAGAPSAAFSSDADGTGTGIFRSAANSIGFVTNGVERWSINASGAINPIADNTYDIGATVQPRDISLDRTLTVGVSTQGASTKTLVESSATAFAQVDIAAGAGVGGYVVYTIFAADAADQQARSGILPFAAVNKAGTETCTIGTVGAATEVVAVSVGTLTNTFTCTTTPTNGILLNANAVSSLTQTTLQIRYRLELAGTATVTPQ